MSNSLYYQSYHRQLAQARNADTDKRSAARLASITEFASWIDAWIMYTTVLCSYYPHLAPRLFLYQHFFTLKSKSFQTKAWLLYDTEFHLKLAANDRWHFEQVDMELWASFFAADGLASAAGQSVPLVCYVCGSTTHLFTACPQLRIATTGPGAYKGKEHQNTWCNVEQRLISNTSLATSILRLQINHIIPLSRCCT